MELIIIVAGIGLWYWLKQGRFLKRQTHRAKLSQENWEKRQIALTEKKTARAREKMFSRYNKK